MVDIVAMLIGVVVGIVASAIAVEFGLKKLLAPPESSKLTTVWSLGELSKPLIVSASLEGTTIPDNARIVSSAPLPEGAPRVAVRTNREVRGSFAVDAVNDRALLFLGGIQGGSLALWTVDERLIHRLRSEFNRLWTRSLDYVEKVSVSQVPRRTNATVRFNGLVEDVVPYRDAYLARMAEDGEKIGVLLDKPLQLQGRRATITGIVRPGHAGYPVVEALEVTAT